MKQQLPNLTEHQIQTLLINYLQAKGWYVMRLNSGKYSVGEGRSKRFIMGQEAGTPDIVAFRQYYGSDDGVYGEDCRGKSSLMFVEVKRPGNKPTFLQDQKMKELEEHGARCIVAHSLEELQAQLSNFSGTK